MGDTIEFCVNGVEVGEYILCCSRTYMYPYLPHGFVNLPTPPEIPI